MFRRTASSCRAIVGTLALLGFAIPVLAQAPAGPALPETSLGKAQPAPKSKDIKPAPSKAPSKSSAAQPSSAPPQLVPPPAPAERGVAPEPAPPANPALPGLQGLMTPNGIALPGGVGFIRPGAETVGVQINTPTGPIEFTVPRRHRNGRPVQGPPEPQATTDAPLFGQPGKAPSSAAPQASIPGPSLDDRSIPADRSAPGDASPLGAGRASRGAREFAHDSRLFHARNYPLVLRRLDRALGRETEDRDLLQLRSLTHLVQGDFKSASADATLVLAQDDVWDWSTLRSLYHAADEYTAMYRALEDRVVANPNAIDLRILLAYHNLMLGHRDAARRHFERVLSLDPSNEVARRMVAAEQPPQPRESAQTPQSPAGSKAPLVLIPARKRPASSGAQSSGGPSIDLGQPAPAPGSAKPSDSKSGS
jgi:hypothetical protein